MKIRHVIVIAIAWAPSLLCVGLWAQGTTQTQPFQGVQEGEPHGAIITGENIGFQRLAGPPDRDGRITGRIMVRINGQWFETVAHVRAVR